MSENEIKPVAWRCIWSKSGKPAWEQYHDESDPMPEQWDVRPNEVRPLYDQSAIDRLTAERDALRADAERYRYLCDVWGDVQSIAQSSKHRAHICTPSWQGDFDTVDAAIDAARAKEPQA